MEKSKISNDSLRLSKLSLLSCQDVPTWYHNLSTDTLLNVFQYFDESELLKTIMLVSGAFFLFILYSALLLSKIPISIYLRRSL